MLILIDILNRVGVTVCLLLLVSCGKQSETATNLLLLDAVSDCLPHDTNSNKHTVTPTLFNMSISISTIYKKEKAVADEHIKKIFFCR